MIHIIAELSVLSVCADDSIQINQSKDEKLLPPCLALAEGYICAGESVN